jgi:hypothetical protein
MGAEDVTAALNEITERDKDNEEKEEVEVKRRFSRIRTIND